MRLLLVTFLALVSLDCFSQLEENPAPHALFKISPAHFAINTLKVGAEIFNQQKTKSFLFYGYARLKNSNQPYYYYDEQYDGFSGELQYRKYISPIKHYTTRRDRDYLQGIYVSGYAQGGSYVRKGEFTQYQYYGGPNPPMSTQYYLKETIANFGSGFTIGVQRTLWNVLFIDVYVGGGIQWANTKIASTNPNPDLDTYNSITSPAYQGIMPKFGLQLGVAL